MVIVTTAATARLLTTGLALSHKRIINQFIVTFIRPNDGEPPSAGTWLEILVSERAYE